MNRAERIAVENMMKVIFSKLALDQSGSGVSKVFSKAAYTSFASTLTSASSSASLTLNPYTGLTETDNSEDSYTRDWPYGRGRIVTDFETFTVFIIVNEQDHLLVSVASNCGQEIPQFQKAMSLYQSIITAIDSQAEAYLEGMRFARNDIFGYLTSNPLHTGTALQTNAVLRAPFLSQSQYNLPVICSKLGLSCDKTQSAVDLRASGASRVKYCGTSDSWLISSKYSFGCTEVEQTQCLIAGLDVLTKLELSLAMSHTGNKGFDALLSGLPETYHLPTVHRTEIDTPKKSGKAVASGLTNIADAVPLITAHTSVTAECLKTHPSLYFSLLPKTAAAGGWSVDRATQAAIDCHHTRCGIYLGGEHSYQAFEKLLVPVIAKLHLNRLRSGPFDALSDVHKTDLNVMRVKGLDAMDEQYLKAFNVEVSRNIRGVPLAPQISRKLRRTVEHILYNSLSTINRAEMEGKYYSLAELHQSGDPQMVSLPPRHDPKVVAGIYRDWPDARGVYKSADGLVSIFSNVDDHMKIVCEGRKDVSISKIIHRLSTTLLAVENALLESGLTFLHSQRLGYLTSTPLLLGTAMSASVSLSLPKLSRTEAGHTEIRMICTQFDVTAIQDAELWIVTSSRCLGQSEVEQYQQLIDCTLILIRTEKDLVVEIEPVPVPLPETSDPLPAGHNLLDDIITYINANPSGTSGTGGVKDQVSRGLYPLHSCPRALIECHLERYFSTPGTTNTGSSIFTGDSGLMMNVPGDLVVWIDPFTRTLHW